MKSITLPNGEQYQFFYDSTYGLINEIIYPTGAWVKYTWKPSDNYSEFAEWTGSNGIAQAYANLSILRPWLQLAR